MHFYEIGTFSLGDNRIEVRVAAVYLGTDVFHSGFFDSLYVAIHKKWLPEEIPKEELTHYGEVQVVTRRAEKLVDYKIGQLKKSLSLPYDSNIYKALNDPKQEEKRQAILIEFQHKLPPIEEHEDFVSTSSLPKGKEDMSAWRKRRANLFKRVKDDDPRLTYEQVDMRAKDMIFL